MKTIREIKELLREANNTAHNLYYRDSSNELCARIISVHKQGELVYVEKMNGDLIKVRETGVFDIR